MSNAGDRVGCLTNGCRRLSYAAADLKHRIGKRRTRKRWLRFYGLVRKFSAGIKSMLKDRSRRSTLSNNGRRRREGVADE